ncbi:hypothetical protein D3C87_1809020 [compost metagenome]
MSLRRLSERRSWRHVPARQPVQRAIMYSVRVHSMAWGYPVNYGTAQAKARMIVRFTSLRVTRLLAQPKKAATTVHRRFCHFVVKFSTRNAPALIRCLPTRKL